MRLSPDTSTTYHSSTFLHRDTPLPTTTMCVCMRVLFYVKGHVGLLLQDMWLLKVFCVRHVFVCTHTFVTNIIKASDSNKESKKERQKSFSQTIEQKEKIFAFCTAAVS